MIKPTRGILAVEDIREEGGFVTPSQDGSLLKKGKVIQKLRIT